MKIHISSHTLYRYDESVSFSPHVMRLFPRQDHALRINGHRFATNDGADVQYRRDLFDNTVASCFYPQSGDTLLIDLELDLDIQERNPFHFLLESQALQLPFAYRSEETALLAPFLLPSRDSASPMISLDFWNFPTRENPADTVAALVDLTQALHKEIAYERREEGAPREPHETLSLRMGACRDTALLLTAFLRQHGLAARFVSGFLCEFGTEEQDKRAEGAMHAWVEVYLPGGGWIGFDPTNGVLCDHLYVATAIGADSRHVAPILGSYYARHAVGSRMENKIVVTLQS